MKLPWIAPLGWAWALAVTGCGSVPHGDFEYPVPFATPELRYPPVANTGGSPDNGEVLIAAMIDLQGSPIDWLVVCQTTPAFAEEALAALRSTRFVPARRDGEEVVAHVGLIFDFSPDGQMMNVVPVEQLLPRLKLNGTSPETKLDRAYWLVDLDAPLKLIHDVRPHRSVSDSRHAGSVLIQLFVDQTGRPRLPMIVRSDDEALSRAVRDAVAQWQYSIPTRGGRPVIAVIRQTFEFKSM